MEPPVRYMSTRTGAPAAAPGTRGKARTITTLVPLLEPHSSDRMTIHPADIPCASARTRRLRLDATGPTETTWELSMLTFDDLAASAPKGRFTGIHRPYSPRDVMRLRGSVRIQHTLADLGANRLWRLLNDEPYVAALGAMSGNQAMQMVKAGLKAIYLSGWQVAADANAGRIA